MSIIPQTLLHCNSYFEFFRDYLSFFPAPRRTAASSAVHRLRGSKSRRLRSRASRRSSPMMQQCIMGAPLQDAAGAVGYPPHECGHLPPLSSAYEFAESLFPTRFARFLKLKLFTETSAGIADVVRIQRNMGYRDAIPQDVYKRQYHALRYSSRHRRKPRIEPC